MTKIMKYLLLWTTVTFLTACNTAPSPAEVDSTADENTLDRVNKTTLYNLVTLKDEHLNALVPHYLKLTKALTDEDITAAKVAAAAIELGATALKGGQHIVKIASAISTASDIEAQRKLFSPLSNAFIGLLKQSGMASGELFIVHCPMALNNTGASWISSTKTVRNPYYGESMLTCGTINATVKH